MVSVSSLSRTVATDCGAYCVAVLPANVVEAQTADRTAPAAEAVVITGSALPETSPGAQPVRIITHEEIATRGALASEVRSGTRGSNLLSVERTIRALNNPNPEKALNVFGDGHGIDSPRSIDELKVSTQRDGRSDAHTHDPRGRFFYFAVHTRF